MKRLFLTICLLASTLSWAQERVSSEQHDDLMVQGRSFFTIPWVAAPSSTTARDGLGPLFNANTCISCHQSKKRVAPFAEGAVPDRAFVFKLSQAALHAQRKPQEITRADPVYGAQIAINGVNQVPAEAIPILRSATHDFVFKDGTVLPLRSWVVMLKDLAYGELAPNTQVSVRLAPALWGMGLINAIDRQALTHIQAQQAAHTPAMAGQINQVYDRIRQEMVPGLFGWKASQPSLLMQTADAAYHDMGLTSVAYPEEGCSALQRACQQAPRGRLSSPEDPGFDISMERLKAIAYYVGELALPKVRHSAPADTEQFSSGLLLSKQERLAQGQQLFNSMQCSVCHQAQQQTQDGRSFAPYSDFLLHDMGPELADARPEFLASSQQWRTAPLWANQAKAQLGLGFLHDGRARTLLEAIAWHGGQATPSREALRQLNATERQALIEFLETL